MMRASANRTGLPFLQPAAQILYIAGSLQTCLFDKQPFPFLTKFLNLFVQSRSIDRFQFFFQASIVRFRLLQGLLFTCAGLLQAGKLFIQRYSLLPKCFDRTVCHFHPRTGS